MFFVRKTKICVISFTIYECFVSGFFFWMRIVYRHFVFIIINALLCQEYNNSNSMITVNNYCMTQVIKLCLQLVIVTQKRFFLSFPFSTEVLQCSKEKTIFSSYFLLVAFWHKSMYHTRLAGTRYKIGLRENCIYLDLKQQIMTGFHWNMYLNLNVKM